MNTLFQNDVTGGPNINRTDNRTKLEIRNSPLGGQGVFAMEDIPTDHTARRLLLHEQVVTGNCYQIYNYLAFNLKPNNYDIYTSLIGWDEDEKIQFNAFRHQDDDNGEAQYSLGLVRIEC